MKTGRMLFACIALAASSQVLAGVSCKAPSRNGDRWSYICSEDGSATAQLICNFNFSVQAADGESGALSAKKAIIKNAKNVVMWSEEKLNGKKITSVTYSGGSCNTTN